MRRLAWALAITLAALDAVAWSATFVLGWIAANPHQPTTNENRAGVCLVAAILLAGVTFFALLWADGTE